KNKDNDPVKQHNLSQLPMCGYCHNHSKPSWEYIQCQECLRHFHWKCCRRMQALCEDDKGDFSCVDCLGIAPDENDDGYHVLANTFKRIRKARRTKRKATKMGRQLPTANVGDALKAIIS